MRPQASTLPSMTSASSRTSFCSSTSFCSMTSSTRSMPQPSWSQRTLAAKPPKPRNAVGWTIGRDGTRRATGLMAGPLNPNEMEVFGVTMMRGRTETSGAAAMPAPAKTSIAASCTLWMRTTGAESAWTAVAEKTRAQTATRQASERMAGPPGPQGTAGCTARDLTQLIQARAGYPGPAGPTSRGSRIRGAPWASWRSSRSALPGAWRAWG